MLREPSLHHCKFDALGSVHEINKIIGTNFFSFVEEQVPLNCNYSRNSLFKESNSTISSHSLGILQGTSPPLVSLHSSCLPPASFVNVIMGRQIQIDRQAPRQRDRQRQTGHWGVRYPVTTGLPRGPVYNWKKCLNTMKIIQPSQTVYRCVNITESWFHMSACWTDIGCILTTQT